MFTKRDGLRAFWNVWASVPMQNACFQQSVYLQHAVPFLCRLTLDVAKTSARFTKSTIQLFRQYQSQLMFMAQARTRYLHPRTKNQDISPPCQNQFIFAWTLKARYFHLKTKSRYFIMTLESRYYRPHMKYQDILTTLPKSSCFYPTRTSILFTPLQRTSNFLNRN